MVGFSAGNQQEINAEFICKTCSLILREPVQMPCSHRQCKSCVESKIQNERVKCVQCHEESDQKEVVLDKGFKNDMKSLPIHCSLCDWKDVFKNYEDHLQQSHPNLSCQYCHQKFVSYDGTYTWKISNFAEKMADAQSEQRTSIYSPPFYSSPTGYKMRAWLHILFNGTTRRASMLLVLMLMVGVNDPILKSPINYKVGFCVYDQTPAQMHIIGCFEPNIRSNIFQRTKSEISMTSGMPISFPLTMFNQEGSPYVRNNTMFIKIMVDFGDMPKALMPYALSLNPGLPTSVQQQMIKHEIERRAQHTLFPGGTWEPNQKLMFLCEMCFLTGQYSDQRFCDHRPKQRWIITQAGRVVRSGLCMEHPIDTKSENTELLGIQNLDFEPSNEDEMCFVHQPMEVNTNHF